MRRLRTRLLALALGAIAAVGLTACGGEDAKLLPGETAREITANLDTVQQLSDEGDCVGAESAAQQVGEQIEAIEGVDAKLKRALEGGAARLEEVIAECEEATEAIAPATVPTEAEEEKGSKEKQDKEKASKPEREATTPAEPSLPPQAEGEGKGLENGNGPPEEEVEAPSGGVSPGSPAGEGE